MRALQFHCQAFRHEFELLATLDLEHAFELTHKSSAGSLAHLHISFVQMRRADLLQKNQSPKHIRQWDERSLLFSGTTPRVKLL